MKMNLRNQKGILLFIGNMIVQRRIYAYVKRINKLLLFMRLVLLFHCSVDEMKWFSFSLHIHVWMCILYSVMQYERYLIPISYYDCCYLFVKYIVHIVTEILSKFEHFSFKYENSINFEQQSIHKTFIAFKWDSLGAKLWYQRWISFK